MRNKKVLGFNGLSLSGAMVCMVLVQAEGTVVLGGWP